MTGPDYKAIGWYAQEHNYRPQLSVPPTQMHFTDKETGKDVVVDLALIKLEYSAHKKAESARKAKAKKMEKKNAK